MMTRVAIYARYSSDLQREASIEDQVEVCRRYAVAQGWQVVRVYADQAQSGSNPLRRDYRQMCADAESSRFDVILCEALDRLSRKLSDVAVLFDRLGFLRIRLFTAAMGEITQLDVGIMGTMGQLYLKDLADKTRRGLLGRVLQGRSGGGIAYGYRAVADDSTDRGQRRIDEAEAAVIRHIFEMFASGDSPRAIAKQLNADGVSGPKGRSWGDTTIRGQAERGTGILNNELYIGELVWNRCSYVKDPSTGKRLARPNPQNQWERVSVPELRIIDQALWDRAKQRQTKLSFAMGRAENGQALNRAHRIKFLLSGLLQCGTCGGGCAIVSRNRYGCVAHRNRGTCPNGTTVSRLEAETRVLDGLRSRLFDPDLFEAFAADYAKEAERLLRQQVDDHVRLKTELLAVDRRIEGIIRAIEDGMYQSSMKERLINLEERKALLEGKLASDISPQSVRLHPNLPTLYRRHVENIERLLGDPELGREAMEAVRALISHIVMRPNENGVVLELHGELASILAIGEHGTKQSTRLKGECSGNVADCVVSVVAGVGFEPTAFRL